ncbi:5'/3'-nucleotidase SurE [Tuwongella immobilis]|uniref:5'-nucleotidase SurE n=1 Tax=Tuwongella immobilis TaxID=692036 RepID=A0A6C2YNJ4_9BACT|nr:5'/3'-nucleotidase SurE [Tuwongella immobilis]VIP03006.1 stationary-phase survival protein : 5'-nucleotidase SurE OS=Singulisphaera acidiphila (strain ATCC BAA-1392 / DSM 18658 / VKM B-2454 / MOB10) GN=surE PE=3 SV=1: SurE [Tuwongella immobilis]VTS03105.1 stationary-phase survival protein : 5'-nucleotidase SurE OS=Singulisphaera acidiphila (strain ATCC BAA-1392 / DSM 18658 / VKM B-2454 / MOB10) GN=surE PE=3 SV=1: SurE [Tuwongella immobilis]
MRILLTNDDGIYAPGLRALRKELLSLGEVMTIAPAAEQSAAGHSVTLLTPLLIQEVFDDERKPIGYAVEGRPADCVKLALLELLPWKPDLIVSGMNAGSNAGINVLYSGTVAAAIEGAFYHYPAIAVSLEYTKLKPLDFPKAATYAIQIIRQILRKPLGAGSLFNVNIPSLEKGPIAGVKVVPQNITAYTERFDRRMDPRGRTYFWAGSDLDCPDPHSETDVTALAESYITITPLQYDLTAHAKLADLREQSWTVE